MIKDGIYFGMPEDVYLAEERLSKSGIKKLRISPADYWADSYMNPNPEVLTEDQEKRKHLARVVGRAYHAARLEPEKFAAFYVRELTPAAFDGADGFIKGGTAMKAKLKEMGEKQTGTTMEQAERLQAAGYEGPIWDIEFGKWQDTLGPFQVTLSPVIYDQITIDVERMKAVPAAHALLTGGFPEVSVFWTCPQTGIPMKARFDYLRATDWTEFKSFANPNGKHLFQCLIDAVQYNRYYIDAAGYLEASEAIRCGNVAIVGDATDAQAEMISAIMAREAEQDCHFVFQQKGGVPNVLERRFEFWQHSSADAYRELVESGATEEHLARARKMVELSGTKSPSAIHAKAIWEIRAAKRDWLAYQEIYERGQPWAPFNPSGTIGDADFRPAWLEDVG